MGSKGSVAVILLVVLVVASLALSGGMFYFFQEERATNFILKQDLEDITAKYETAQSELNEEKKRVSTLNIQIKESQDRIEDLNKELQKEKSSKLEIQSNIEELSYDLEEQKRLRLDLEDKLSQANKDVNEKESKIEELESEKTKLQTQIKDLEQQKRVQLGTIVVGPQGAVSEEGYITPAQKPANLLEGKVLVVNKDYNFVVINLGSKDGVRLGEVFSVYRKDQFLGDVKVEKVHDSMSAAGFVSDYSKNKISEGDKVVQKVK